MSIKIRTHMLDTCGLVNASSDTHWRGRTLCGMECGGQVSTLLGPFHNTTCGECQRAAKARDARNVIGKPEL